MDPLIEDGQVAQQVIRLLGQDVLRMRTELEETKRQLRAQSSVTTEVLPDQDARGELQIARDEIARLQAQIAHLSRALNDHRSGNINEERKPDLSALDTLQSEIDHLTDIIARKEAGEQGHLEKISTLLRKVVKLRDKCERYKSSRDDLRARLAEASTEPCQDVIPSCEMDDFPGSFLQEDPPLSNADPPRVDIKYIWEGPNFLLSRRQMQLWPSHRYNPGTGVNGWEQFGFTGHEKGHRCELLYCEEEKWFYLGTYELVGLKRLSLESVQAITHNDTKGYMMKQTVVSPELVPPFLHGMLDSMYDTGALMIEAAALCRVGFNQQLYHAVLSARKNPRKSKEGGNATEASHKRGVEEVESDQDEHQPAAKKKRNSRGKQYSYPAHPSLFPMLINLLAS
ncbi:hypothetical protein GLOTRDRAFT_135453 [Gloeophyllum trabeum ATCC 11539]|uniref:Uncharacterized protein n=1 Tax=Gloeophyllum trabeum (strain ATCC 11539 / FP-39264 / Madison 617) TaxID=670483 RepID=S7S0G8_GLOTA|nr:uncharacterized protein GLOTRDRAFT_135453 [Gloeophyllum trabeum ATCC 11539]EPQ60845.1 hypothetical protein GLOTRDRAFT_135453 [Gloeophyllum trabeum ATCC 11539]